MPGAWCARSRACSVVNTRVSHHGHTGTPGIPRAMVLTAYFALSPVIGLFCHRHQRIESANLTPASRHQDHTTSPSAIAPFVKGAFASTASRLTSVTIAKRPSARRDGIKILLFLPRRQIKFGNSEIDGSAQFEETTKARKHRLRASSIYQ